jgi:four helix bundle protein
MENGPLASDIQAAPDHAGRALDKVAAYRLASELTDSGWGDAIALQEHPILVGVAPQLVRALGSILANIAEGYARKSPRERIRFYEYALGSVEEAVSWLHVARRALSADTAKSRTEHLTSIRRLLLTMIASERRGNNWNSRRKT